MLNEHLLDYTLDIWACATCNYDNQLKGENFKYQFNLIKLDIWTDDIFTIEIKVEGCLISMLKVREAVAKEVKEKNMNDADAKKLLVTTIKVISFFLIY